MQRTRQSWEGKANLQSRTFYYGSYWWLKSGMRYRLWLSLSNNLTGHHQISFKYSKALILWFVPIHSFRSLPLQNPGHQINYNKRDTLITVLDLQTFSFNQPQASLQLPIKTFSLLPFPTNSLSMVCSWYHSQYHPFNCSVPPLPVDSTKWLVLFKLSEFAMLCLFHFH